MKTNARNLMVIAAAAATSALGTPASAETMWRASLWSPARAVTKPFEWYAKEVAAKTNGQMKIEFAYAKGKAGDAADMVKSGSAEMAYFCAQYFPEAMPLATVLDLPMFAPEKISVMGQVELALGDHPAIQAELRRSNAKMIIPLPLPQYQLMGTRRVAKLEDFKGAKLRISGEMGKVLQEYGAQISVVPSNESTAALKAGTLDLVALPYTSSFASFRIHDAAKFVTEKISLGAPLCYLGASAKAWDALPASTQKVMLSLRQPAVAQYEEIYAAEDAPNIAAFKEKGLQFVDFSPVDRARLLAKAIKVWQIWVDEREKQGLKGREVFEFAQSKIREFSRKQPN
jgi:TRAP-type C4-dicarboxylate transport system substrate-binding protein